MPNRSNSQKHTPVKKIAENLRRLARMVEESTPDEAWCEGLELALQPWEEALPAPSASPPAAVAEDAVGDSNGKVGQAKGKSGKAAHLIWCDGSCAPNPGPGGWGAIVESGGERLEISGSSRQSTNNIMELMAVCEALERIPKGEKAHITTDSRYVMDGVTKWMKGWKKKGWRKSNGDPVLNQEVWERLDRLLQNRPATWEWVRGHTGHPENERCDELANAARISQ